MTQFGFLQNRSIFYNILLRWEMVALAQLQYYCSTLRRHMISGLRLSSGSSVTCHMDKRYVENQGQPSLACEYTLRVYEHSNDQKSPLPFVALTMSHRIIFYDTYNELSHSP